MAIDRPVGMKMMAQSNSKNTYNLYCQDCKSIFYVTLTPLSKDKQANEPEQVKDEKLKKQEKPCTAMVQGKPCTAMVQGNLSCPDCNRSIEVDLGQPGE